MLEHRNKNSARWRLLFNKGKINRNTQTWLRWRFRIIYRFPCRFIVHNHTYLYNTQMSLLLGIHNCRIWPTKFRELLVCFSNIILDMIEVSSSRNMAQAKCLVSSTVNFSQYMVCQCTFDTSVYRIQTWATYYQNTSRLNKIK